MRKITEDSVEAFMMRKSFRRANMSTDGTNLFLHGNRIAYHGTLNGGEGIFLTLAGWNTPTTKDRLKGILNRMGHQGGFSPILQIWTQRGQTYIGEIGKSLSDAMELDPDTVIFVAFPVIAGGMSAVRNALILG